MKKEDSIRTEKKKMLWYRFQQSIRSLFPKTSEKEIEGLFLEQFLFLTGQKTKPIDYKRSSKKDKKNKWLSISHTMLTTFLLLLTVVLGWIQVEYLWKKRAIESQSQLPTDRIIVLCGTSGKLRSLLNEEINRRGKIVKYLDGNSEFRKIKRSTLQRGIYVAFINLDPEKTLTLKRTYSIEVMVKCEGKTLPLEMVYKIGGMGKSELKPGESIDAHRIDWIEDFKIGPEHCILKENEENATIEIKFPVQDFS